MDVDDPDADADDGDEDDDDEDFGVKPSKAKKKQIVISSKRSTKRSSPSRAKGDFRLQWRFMTAG